MKTPVLEGVTGKIFARIINRSGPGAAPLNVMGNPIPYFPVDETNNAGDTMTIVTHETINGKVTVGGTVPSSEWKYAAAALRCAAAGHGAARAGLPEGRLDPAKLTSSCTG